MNSSGNKRGIAFMIATSLIFAIQDGLSRHLAAEYNVMMVVMIRYWFFGAFVIALSASRPGGILGAAATRQPFLQVFRGILLAVEVCIMVSAIVLLGLIESHAIFACYPLLVAALSGPILGENVGWRRWFAIGIGFIGVLVILEPGARVFSAYSIVAVVAALLMALYSLLTRYASRRDSAETSFFWTGAAGAVVMTLVGIGYWEPLSETDWIWMLCLCATGISGHYTLIKSYEAAEASVVQPFAYLHLFFAALIGLSVFGDALELNTAVGCSLVVLAGLFTIFRQGRKKPTSAREGDRKTGR